MPNENIEIFEHVLQNFAQPHRWHFLPKPTSAEMGQSVLQVLMTQAGQQMLQGLVHAYLLAEVPDGLDMARYVGRQDVVKHLLEMAGHGLMQRQSRIKESEHGREGHDWFNNI